MRLETMGVPADYYYRPGMSQRPPVTQTPATASATGSFQQSAAGSLSLIGNPGLWLVAGVVACFLILHKAGLDGG